MGNQTFRALVVDEAEDGRFIRRIQQRPLESLPPHDVLIRVSYSSLNYKDALSASGHKGVTRSYPHTPGIDAAGTVVVDRRGELAEGTPVLVTGFDLGMNTAGGLGEYIRVPSEWVVPLPEGLDDKTAMILGTAGFTAGLSIYRLIQHGVKPDMGEILVTGATGGVGSLAVAILRRLGYAPVAVSGKADAHGFLEMLGARAILSREEATGPAGRPLLKPRWAGVVDTVGGEILASAIKATQYNGAVTCCGLVASADLALTVYPFILRGVSLYGIDSAECGRELRMAVWTKLADEWRPDHLEQIAREVTLEEVEPALLDLLEGAGRGRIVVKLAV